MDRVAGILIWLLALDWAHEAHVVPFMRSLPPGYCIDWRVRDFAGAQIQSLVRAGELDSDDGRLRNSAGSYSLTAFGLKNPGQITQSGYLLS
jgi:hypothetical protein